MSSKKFEFQFTINTTLPNSDWKRCNSNSCDHFAGHEERTWYIFSIYFLCMSCIRLLIFKQNQNLNVFSFMTLSMKKAQYSGMTTVQVGNPSFLYEEMLEDYEDSSVNPDFNWEQDEKVHRIISASNLVLRGRSTVV